MEPTSIPTSQDFEPSNAESYSSDEEVVLRLTAKNPGPQAVLLKVYELSPWHVATATSQPPAVDLNLSGVAASRELVLRAPAAAAGGGAQAEGPVVK
jgi:hypothetical protein